MKCLSCNRNYPASQITRHHWLLGARRGRRTPQAVKDWLNNPVNKVNTCFTCHALPGGNASDPYYASALTQEFREKVMEIYIGRYDVRGWLKACPDSKKRDPEYKAALLLYGWVNLGERTQYHSAGQVPK